MPLFIPPTAFSPNRVFLFLFSCLILAHFFFLPGIAYAEDETETIRLQLKWKHAFQFAGYYAALDLGFYENAGLSVTIHEHHGKKSTLEMLLDGETDYAVSGANIVLQRANGKPLVALASIFQHSPYAFLVRADSGIEKVEDFAGLRVMLGKGSQDAALHATLRRAGINQGDFVNQPTNFDALSLVRGQTDVFNAYVTDQGFTLQEAGVEGRYILPNQYGVDFYGDVLATTEEEATTHPQRLRAFRDASLKGWDYALQHPDEIITLILEKYNTQGFSREHLEYEAQASRELIQPLLVKIGYMNPSRWEHIKNVFIELELIPSVSNIEGLMYEEHKEVQNWARWMVEHKYSLIAATVFSFVAILLSLLFQMRRLISRRTAELAESEQHWRTLVDAEPACVNTMDSGGRLASINSSGLHLMEADSFAEIKGRNINDLIDKEFQEAFIQLTRRVFEGESGNLVCSMTGLKGGWKWIETHAVPFRDSEGKITHLLSVTQDLTERKEVEANQERLRRKFSQKHKMIALGQLSGGIAHDFNNILGIVIGYAALAKECDTSVDKEKLSDYLEKVVRAGNRAQDLVNQLLAFSRGDVMEEKPVQILPLVIEDIKMSRATMPSSIEIVTELAEDLPNVLMDPVQFNQVIMNLSINARDAMGGIGVLTIRLRMARSMMAECIACHQWVRGDWVEFAVSDTGTGIDPEILGRLFDPFFTTKEVGEGTGMGLSMIHGIMNRLGGHILVETEPGKGSTFRLLFPPVIEKAPELNGNQPVQPLYTEGEQRHVLVLDDEPELASYIGELLLMHDYRVTVTTNGMKALEVFRENPDNFSLLITDQTMPGLSGVEIAKRCREIRPGFPVILCTGFSETINRASAAEIDIGFIKKPIDASRLLQLAGQYIFTNEQ
jgi:two-component system, cell cycle sensor histidine kinase and response regulator CckA